MYRASREVAGQTALPHKHSLRPDGIGNLWEYEDEELWKDAYKLCGIELDRIKEEEKALENRNFRAEGTVVKRQWDGEKMLLKQIKFHEAILKLAKSEVVSRWGLVDLPNTESESSDSNSDSDSD
jgi:hypothetical protein